MNRAALLAVLLLAPLLRADEATGLQLARQARQKLAAGDPAGALELLDRARTELPGSDVVACTRGDALASLGKLDEALNEYARAATSPLAFHAAFNGASSLSTAGEAELSVSGVPADVGALPEGPQPEMLAALQAARPKLERSRAGFLGALDLRDDADARESVGALNRRLDALKAIEEELKKRAEDEKQKDENKDKDKDKQDQQNKDQQDQKPPDQKDQPQDQQPQDKQDQQDQQNQQDQPPQDQPQDEPKEDPEQKDQPAEPQDGKDQQAQPDSKDQPPAKPAQELSEQEVQQLLDTLAQLEDAARERQKARDMRAHKKAARDW